MSLKVNSWLPASQLHEARHKLLAALHWEHQCSWRHSKIVTYTCTTCTTNVGCKSYPIPGFEFNDAATWASSSRWAIAVHQPMWLMIITCEIRCFFDLSMLSCVALLQVVFLLLSTCWRSSDNSSTEIPTLALMSTWSVILASKARSCSACFQSWRITLTSDSCAALHQHLKLSFPAQAAEFATYLMCCSPPAFCRCFVVPPALLEQQHVQLQEPRGSASA